MLKFLQQTGKGVQFFLNMDFFTASSQGFCWENTELNLTNETAKSNMFIV